MMLKVGTLDLKWAEEFRDKLEEARDTLKAFAHLAHTTMHLLRFLVTLKDHPGVTTDTKVSFVLVAGFQTDNSGEKQNHTLEVQHGVASAPVMIQALTAIAGEHCSNLKQVEQDTPLLQKILGAVSEFKETLDIHVGCNGCVDCGEDGEEPLN